MVVSAVFIIAFAVLVGTMIYLKPPPVRYYFADSPAARSGEQVYRRSSCSSCHEVFGNGTTAFGPALDGIGSRRTRLWLFDYLLSPTPGVSEKKYRLLMPAQDKMPRQDLENLVVYLAALQEKLQTGGKE